MTEKIIDLTRAEARERKLLPKLAVGPLRLQLETLRMPRVEPITIFLVVVDYMREHVMPQRDVDAKRYIYVFNHILRLVSPSLAAEKFTRASVRDYVTARRAEGAAGPTIRRELTMLCAALNHAAKEQRLDKALKFKDVMPPPSEPRQRYLTREEFERLLAAPMEPRIYRFFVLDFYCGARSRAIEELTWDRVDFANRTIDFRVPGVACSTTYHKAKAVMKSIGIDERGVARHVGRHTVVSWLLQKGASLTLAADYIADKPTTVEKTYKHTQAQHILTAVNTLH